MKILHTADTHIGTFPGPTEAGKNLRMRDTTNCMVALANSAMTEKPDLIIIAGDLFHRSRLWADEMLVEIQIAAEWLIDLSKVAPVCLLYGTPNHDNEEAFYNLSRAVPENVHIFTRPERRVIQTASGDVQVCALPGFDRGFYRTQNPGVSREEENAVFSNTLSQIVMGLSAQCTQDSPCVLMAHYTVPGADLESGQVQIFSQSEPMLTVDTLAAADFDLVTLGHIHKPQLVNGFSNVYYSGAINRLNFNDEGQARGFWYHEVNDNALVDSRFVATPARAFCTVNLQTDEVGAFNLFCALPELPEVKGSIVRVLYSCTDEHEKALNKSALERYLYEKGAFWVQEISPAEIIVTLDRKAMDEATSPEENLVAYLTEHGATEDRIQAAFELARPIIADAVANARDKRSTGVLRPVSIEVNNYRNYREASFDFSDVSMCTINGANGAGKSSLFMDAIVDCLYEEPREADLTGWIRADDDARSGAITFTFAIGEQLYRVSRTRTRSGKATLNLSELVDEEWKNRSCERLRDTQDEIITLLGMDIGTFKSCALIMQDQYGIFLEAGKEQRMETLAAMLGLDVYEAMEEAARAKATDMTRAIKSAQDQETRFDIDLQREGPALQEKAEAEAQIVETTAQMDTLREQASEAHGKIARARDLSARITQLAGDLQSKQNALRQVEQQHEAAIGEVAQLDTILTNEAFIVDQAAKYSDEQAKADSLAARVQAVQHEYDLSHMRANLQQQNQATLATAEGKRDRLLGERKSVEETTVTLLQYKDSASKRDAAAEQIREMEARQKERIGLLEQLRTAKSVLDAYGLEHDQAITTKKAEIKIHTDRAALLLDSKCIDPDNAKCVFLEDAVRSRDLVPALELEMADLHAKGEDKLLGLREAESAAQMALARMPFDEAEMTALRQTHQRHIMDAAQYGQISTHLDRMAAIDRELSEIDSDMKLIRASIQAADDAGKKCEELRTRLESLKTQHSDALATVQRLQIYADQHKALPETKARRAQAAVRKGQLDTMVLEHTIACTQAQKELDALRAEPDDLDQHEAALAVISAEIREMDAVKVQASTRLGSANKVLEIVGQAKQQVAILRGEVNALSESAALYADLRQAFSRDGIPHNIIRSILPALESTSNNILSQMTGGKMSLEFVTERTLKSNAKKEVTTLDIFIHEAGRTRLPYLSKSGGEKVKVSLSVVLALSEIMSRRAGIQLGMLFIDEPPFLDDLGTQAYCDALDAIRTRYPGHIIMAITHDPTMKARFPQSIDIERTEEGSKVIYN